MGFLGKIAANLATNVLSAYNEKGEAAFDALIEKALSSLPEKEGLDALMLGTRNGAEEALKTLQSKKQELLALGQLKLLEVLMKLATGKLEEAADVVAKAPMTEADRLIASMEATDKETLEAKKKYEERKAKAIALLRQIGSLTARYALPALLAAISKED